MEETFSVPVDGGDLLVRRWGSGEGPVLLALHGITANSISFRAIVRALGDDVTVVAPDLRGRCGSNGLPGPYSMARHADDAVAVLDHLGVDRAVVLGHSMGGFVAVVLADRHAGRVSRLVLLDGGLPVDVPEAARALPTEDLVKAIVGPSIDRLRMTFATRDAYRDFWRAHPALAHDWNDDVEAYVDYDLGGEEPELRSRVDVDAVIGDSESQLVRDDIPKALTNLRHPAVLLRAERGLLDGPPLYEAEWVATWQAQLPAELRHETFTGVNHFTIALAERGAKAVATVVRAELAAT